ncbi:MAG: Pur operon repressor [Firmicutes bacterium ADurb.Bin182]|nr:MAG: Pur operon repressor [Firmicutes bacterium ADurb.Bin182]
MRELCARPNRLISLGEFAEQFGCAKSSLSEDIAILRGVTSRYGRGIVETVNGSAGGVRFLPFYSDEADRAFIGRICTVLRVPERKLPGGFLYIADLLSKPEIMSRMGEIFAKQFYKLSVDVVVTVESMGVPIALMTAQALGVPLITARRNHTAAEGSSVTINYASSSNRMQTMSLSRRLMEKGQRALIIDDFMKGGGTAKGLEELMAEFGVFVSGAGVIFSTSNPEKKRVERYLPLMVLNNSEGCDTGTADIYPASWL